MRVTAFTKYGHLAASTRQRFLQYLPYLERNGIEVELRALLPNEYVRALTTGERFPRRKIAAAYVSRAFQLATNSADVLWIYAELFPFVPALLERLALPTGTPIIYDFDDAFFHPHENYPRTRLKRLFADKFESLLKTAAACCCGNDYLRDYAARFCSRTIVLPTVVDTNVYAPALSERSEGPPVVGWIGSPTTWDNVRPLLSLLAKLTEQSRIRFRAIGAGSAADNDCFPGMELVAWSKDSEVTELQNMDIGIMPLLDLPFQRGKSGYKLVQYMACGLPVIATPVGVNTEIVEDGLNGFSASGISDWERALQMLVSDAMLRRQMGQEGRKRVIDEFSLAVHAPRLAQLFASIGERVSR
jgi:glycosyltransferase involved in cell wall biosynthesis